MGYVGLTGSILNGVLLWMSVGYYQTKDILDEPHCLQFYLVKYTAFTCIASGGLFSMTQSFLLDTTIIAYTLETTQCQIAWRLAMWCWSVQRYALCMLPVLRVKFVFSGCKLQTCLLSNVNYVLSILTLVHCMVVLCLCLFPVSAELTGGYIRCSPAMLHGVHDPNAKAVIIAVVCSVIVALDVLFPVAVTGYLVITMRHLLSLGNGPDPGDEELKQFVRKFVATNSLAAVSGVVCVIISLSLGSTLWLPIDSAICSLSVFLSFQLQLPQIGKKYVCWPLWLRNKRGNDDRHQPTTSQSYID